MQRAVRRIGPRRAALLLIVAALALGTVSFDRTDAGNTSQPRQPSGLSATATSASLTLSWTAVSGATSYEVKRGASGAATTVSSGTSHSFSGLSAGANYTLYARAKNSGGASDWSSLTAITAPATPDASLLRLYTDHTNVGLEWWRTRVTGATSYEVKLGPRGAVTTPSAPPHGHLFTGLWTVGEEYTLYVRARNSGGASDWAWATIDGRNPPLALTGLSATATSTSLTLSWTSAPSNKTTYEVKLGASGTVVTVAATGHTFTTRGTGDKVASELNHTFTGLTGSTEYTLYVRGKNSGGTSSWSSISGTTTEPPELPEAPESPQQPGSGGGVETMSLLPPCLVASALGGSEVAFAVPGFCGAAARSACRASIW